MPFIIWCLHVLIYDEKPLILKYDRHSNRVRLRVRVRVPTFSIMAPSIVMCAGVLTSWVQTLVFFRLMVSPYCLQASAKQSLNLWSAASLCVTRAASSANSISLIRTDRTLVLARSLARLNSLPSDAIIGWVKGKGQEDGKENAKKSWC